MPAINVARTDTFEQQRVKINEIGSQIFAVTSGGSNLATGELRIGDGTRTSPALAFTSDETLGIYKPETSTLGFVTSGKNILDLAPLEVVSYKDIKSRKRLLIQSGISFASQGQNYDTGSYTGIFLTGGSGEGATVDLDVLEFAGTITNEGANYLPGSYTGIELLSSGSPSISPSIDFDVEGLDGTIEPGSGYVSGIYSNVPLTGGSGTGAEAQITITGNTDYPGVITNPGSGYTDGVYGFIQAFNTPTTTYTVTTIANPGSPPPDNVYQIDGNTQQALSFIVGNTYRFDQSDASNTGHPINFRDSGGGFLSSDFIVLSNGVAGSPGAFTDLIILPTAPLGSITYVCENHSGMGASATVGSGASGQYGFGASYNIEISGGSAISIVPVGGGSFYQAGEVLQFPNTSIGGTGSGIVFTLTTPSYNGVVDSVVITDEGQDYLIDDVLSAADSDLGGGGGSNFTYTVTTNPGKITSVTFSSYGSDNVVGDVLSLPTGVTNVSTVLPGQVNGVSATLNAGSSLVSVASTAGLAVGMVIYTDFGSTGDAGSGTLTISSINGSTQIIMSGNAITGGAATLTFVSPLGLSTIEVSDASGIFVGDNVTQVSGSGDLGQNIVVSQKDETVTPNQVTLSAQPVLAGSAVLNFSPAYGIGSPGFLYTIDTLGVIDTTTFTITDGGNGYNVGDNLSVDPSSLIQPITYLVQTNATQTLTFSSTISAATFAVGDIVKVADGALLTGSGTGTTLLSEADQTYSGITVFSTSGSGQGGTIEINRDSNGDVSSVTITGGLFYEIGDTITVPGASVGGSTPTDDVTITVGTVSVSTDAVIYQVNSSGGNVTNLVVYSAGFTDADDIIISGQTTTYTLSTASSTKYKFFFDLNDGNGYQITPDLTFYVGNKYKFDLTDSSNSQHLLSFSAFPGGFRAPSLVENIATTLSSSSTSITVSSTSGIIAGMQVIKMSGDGELGVDTTVLSVDNATTLTLSATPLVSGDVVLNFAGTEFTDGLVRTQSDLELSVTANTPNPLYYFNSVNATENEESGGDIGSEAEIVVDPNNPKTFGSGFLLTVVQTQISDTVEIDVVTGNIKSTSLESSSLQTTTAEVLGTLTATDIDGGDINITNLVNPGTINVNSAALSLTGNLSVGSNFQVTNSSGNLVIGGTITTTSTINMNSEMLLENNEISTQTNNLVLTPYTGKVVEINTTTALNIPAGDTSQRPAAGTVANGSIRFNTQTNQYEGYSAISQAWSSLGGVRDLDGNTTILAEETIGANDNTLWFINDNINTIRFTPNQLEFVNNKKIHSPAVNTPSYTVWTANTPVILGQYVKWLNNLYEVTVAGTTGTSGNEPIHTSGAQLNGTAELTWSQLAVGPLTFEEIEVIRIGPNGDCPLSINNDLRLFDNVVTTDLSDLVLRPNAGKKVVIDATSTLAIPVGTDGERGVAIQGSIRFNTSSTQFEGYDGVNWGSLGGVKDVDQNTYIIPETAPGTNENILYFFNDNNNTLRLTTNELQFDTVDTIVSSTSDEFEITASLMTFDGAATTLDNTLTDTTFLHSSKQYFDLGLSSGLFVEPVLRLDNQGDVYLNTGFGTGTYNGVKVFDGDLKEFELSDIKITTDKVTLVKGSIDNTNSILYATSNSLGSKTVIVAHNVNTNDKEFIEFGVTDDGTDVFHTEYGNARTGVQLVIPTFEVTGANEVRLNFAVGATVGATETVNITVTSTITKK
ncbi:virion structural protein [Synechococcus phage S-H9-1]|uniref:Virion structural protein n=1 Tax=Synechococcus phage S-H9-1 TaxID=2783674 RepID=A0A873WFU4_9CAUD|nr:virion structural protein [Synechococcus phage S-H9-1]QPB08256.1 virion structural protein [Synechococcus phage S-H9-1]